MIQHMWVSETRKSIVCVDSYQDGVLKGWFYDSYWQIHTFSSLSQFLMKMENQLDEAQMPQASTVLRRYPGQSHALTGQPGIPNPKGAQATFELKVLFRQHTSWQGVLRWREQNLEHSFRSVLELVALLDSILTSQEGSVAV